MDVNISAKLKKLGYPEKWMTYGFLTEEELNQQYDRYFEALQNPDEDDDGDRHTEHLRHASFIKMANKNEPLTAQELNQLIELVKLDSDVGMAESGLKLVLEKRRMPAPSDIHDWGELKEVYLYFKAEVDWENMIDGSDLQVLELKFQDKHLFITAIGLNDSILISNTSFKALNDFSKKDLSQKEPWTGALGKHVLFFWTLINSQDYRDGFQIQFGPINKTKTVQALVEASKFHFYTVENNS